MNSSAETASSHDKKLFIGCFIALVATAFGFIARALTAAEWGPEFGLSETQVGEILGAGLWPFSISIIVFSLIIDKVGYRSAMLFGLFCHTVSTIVIVAADSYEMMYLGTFILALGCGTVEAYINPLVATMFNKDKTRWLNMLHAGWPGGLVLGGIIALLMGPEIHWKLKISLIMIPTAIYAFMLWDKTFPEQERVAAGVSYQDMLKEVGGVGALIISALVFMEVGRVFAWSLTLVIALIAAATIAYSLVSRSVGRPLFIFFLLIMMPLATTELGVDSWITSLMSSSMEEMGIAAGWVLVYTSAIMTVLRLFAGPLVHRFSPLGLLAICSLIAASGLVLLSGASGAVAILVAATLYGIGKSFFWPTTLGIVAEQFPRGGALTLNTVAGVGMLAVGIVGSPILGGLQDSSLDRELAAKAPALHAQVVIDEKVSITGSYKAVNTEALAAAGPEAQAVVAAVQGSARKQALSSVAILPLFMFACYVLLMLWFRGRGGYKPVDISTTF